MIVAIVALIRVFSRRPGPGDRDRSTPEHLLAERFARGEIDEQTYRRDLETLRRLHSPHPAPDFVGAQRTVRA
ncbi:hypothetical protein AB0K15_32670 [Amycolatopsis sp. NPDC049253]|uniref:SHOCT domain-containing protein n=1 Tax=Amycolatopsis sp. NPDC049253 TaxID=3155274 RepID=UPI003422E0F5